MGNTIEYIFSLQDKISSKIGNITVTSDRMLGRFADLERKSLSVNKTFNETGRTLGALREKIALLQAEREWIPSGEVNSLKAYNREIRTLNREITRLESLEGSKFSKWSKEAFSAIPGSSLISNPLVAGAAAIGFAGKSALSFDEGMAKVNITAQLEGESLDRLKDKLKQVARENKTDILVAPVGFEKINSQVNDVDLSLSILDASLKGSKAGFTDLDTVSGALAQTLSIVGKENTTAMEVLDTFFAAKRVGAGEFVDFARYMPNLIAGASNLGISFKQVAGTFAYMTGKGQSAERASVLMENAFSVLGRADVRGKMEKAGIKVFDQAGKIRSVVDIFSDLQRVMGALNDEQKSSLLEKLGLVDKEAKNAFAIMTSDITKLRESMTDVMGSAGETQKALGFSANAVQKATQVWDQFKNIGTDIGGFILPLISAGLDVVSIVLSGVAAVIDTVSQLFAWWFVRLQQGNPLVWGLTAAIGALSAALLLNYARTNSVLLLTKAKVVWDGIQAGATWLLTGAQWALNGAFLACPLTWIVLVIGALVAVVVALWNRFEGFRKVVLGLWEVIKEFGRALIDAVVHPFKQVLSGIGNVCSALVSLVKGNFSEAADAAKQGFKDIASGTVKLNPLAVGFTVAKDGQWEKAWQKGQSKGAESWKASQIGKQQASPTDELFPQLPGNDAMNVDYDALMKKLQKATKGAKVKKVLKLGDGSPGQNYNESATYTAATRKIVSVKLNPALSVPELPSGNKPDTKLSGVPAVVADATKKTEGAQEYPADNRDFLKDIMLNVRRIAATAALPLALSLTPGQMTAAAQADSSPDRTVTGESSGTVIPAKGQMSPMPAFTLARPLRPAVEIPRVSIPQTVSVPAPSTEIYKIESDRLVKERTREVDRETIRETGKQVRVERICDQVVIHIQQMDDMGKDTVRREMISLLNEIYNV